MSEAALRERIDYLEAEVDRLNRLIGASDADAQVAAIRDRLGMKASAARVLKVLLSGSPGKAWNKEALHNAYCAGRLDQPDIQIVDTLVCFIRKALRPHGITIETVWGTGYRLAPDMRAKIEALLCEVPA